MIEDLRARLTPQVFAEAFDKGTTLSYADALDAAARATETRDSRQFRRRSSVATHEALRGARLIDLTPHAAYVEPPGYEPSAGRPGHRRERNGHASRSHWSIATARSKSRSARDARTHDRTIASAAPLTSGSM